MTTLYVGQRKMKCRSIILILAFLCGCDTFYRVSRSAPSNYIPPIEEIEKEILSIPSIQKVEARFIQPSKHFSFYKGIGKNPNYYQLLIWSDSLFVTLVLGREEGKEIVFEYGWRGSRKPIVNDEKETNALIDIVYGRLLEKFPSLPPLPEFTEN